MDAEYGVNGSPNFTCWRVLCNIHIYSKRVLLIRWIVLDFFFYCFMGLSYWSLLFLSQVWSFHFTVLVAFLIFDLQHLQGRVLDWMGRTFPKDRQTYEWDVTLQSYVPAIKAPSTWAAVKHLLVMIWVLIKFIWCGFDWIRFFILLGFGIFFLVNLFAIYNPK
jgi:hypothetical protein